MSNWMNFFNKDFLNKNASSSPSIPGFALGNAGAYDNYYTPATGKGGKLPPWLGGLDGIEGLGGIGGLGGAGDEKGDKSMADVLGKYIGNSTMESQMADAAKYGEKAQFTKFGLNTTQQALNNIAAGMQDTGKNLLNASTNTGLGIMQLAGKQQPGMQTAFNFSPLAGSYFNYL